MSQISKNRNATINDVARMASVSSATVSRVINRTAVVNPQTLEKVQKAIVALHYVPSSAAQSLAGKKNNTIGLIVPGISEVFFVPLLRGIEMAAALAGYNLLIHTTHFQHQNQGYKTLGDHNTDGLLVFSDSLNHEELHYLTQSNFPCVLIYQNPPDDIPLPSINIDNKNGARQIVEHLIQVHQRRNIVFLRGPQNTHDSIQREQGYRQALQQNGLPYDEQLIARGDFLFEVAADSIRNLIHKGIEFDAVFSADDGSAFGAFAALKETGVCVPEDVSLVGFDDVYFAAHFSPPLTTVQAPTEAVGKLAVETLIQRMNGKEVQQNILLPTRLMLRHSCGCKQ
ncbi:MAG: LacI family DNA-binding transcriptional regulator [Anaerolineaceae bacterium]|nr:LacI family DNA-binding transcriptional regulator [Anaerolineaceae bacterium]